MATRQGSDLQIGEVAERTGVTQRTLRFYEEKGLLKPPSRMEGGFRLYSEEDVKRVEQIRQHQTLLGMSLAEIKDLVEAQDTLEQIRAEWRPDAEVTEKLENLRRAMEVTERQYGIIHQKLEALSQMSEQLEKRMEQYRTWETNLEARLSSPTARA